MTEAAGVTFETITNHDYLWNPDQAGADASIVDDSFDATPAGWAAHFGHLDIQRHLEDLPR